MNERGMDPAAFACLAGMFRISFHSKENGLNTSSARVGDTALTDNAVRLRIILYA
jgi:hypothetical protein